MRTTSVSETRGVLQLGTGKGWQHLLKRTRLIVSIPSLDCEQLEGGALHLPHLLHEHSLNKSMHDGGWVVSRSWRSLILEAVLKMDGWRGEQGGGSICQFGGLGGCMFAECSGTSEMARPCWNWKECGHRMPRENLGWTWTCICSLWDCGSQFIISVFFQRPHQPKPH